MPQVITHDGAVFNFADTTPPNLQSQILNNHTLFVAQRAGRAPAMLTRGLSDGSQPAPFSPMTPPQPNTYFPMPGPPPTPDTSVAAGVLSGARPGPDTEASLRYYWLGPVNGLFGHSYVYLRDPVSGKIDIARAGPSETYPGILDVTSNAQVQAKHSHGPIFLDSQLHSQPLSQDYSKDTSVADTVPGTETIVPAPLNQVEDSINSFDDRVNSARLSYRSLTLNSNSYAFSLYNQLAGRRPNPLSLPLPLPLPASGTDLGPLLPSRNGQPPIRRQY